MGKKHWKERFGSGGVCCFRDNYNFYFKWLLSKTVSCFYIDGLNDDKTKTLDTYYTLSSLICDGDICITDFNEGKLYACIGSPGGKPDEYYKSTLYTIANPVLGSKTVEDGVNGVIIYNTPTDAYVTGGLYGLICQTATLLADNIVSINCCQINSRITALVTADSKPQAAEAESVMKSIYAGNPYKVIPSDMVDKVNINPIADTGHGQMLAELVELHTYIVSNYFQSIGIRSNNLRKKSHMLQDEIDVQNEFLKISIYELLTSWQKGFDKVNELYGTDIHVRVNPTLLDELGDSHDNEINNDNLYSDNAGTDNGEQRSPAMEYTDGRPRNPAGDSGETGENSTTAPDNADSIPDTVGTVGDADGADDVNAEIEEIEKKEELIGEIVDMINDKGEVQEDENA